MSHELINWVFKTCWRSLLVIPIWRDIRLLSWWGMYLSM